MYATCFEFFFKTYCKVVGPGGTISPSCKNPCKGKREFKKKYYYTNNAFQATLVCDKVI